MEAAELGDRIEGGTRRKKRQRFRCKRCSCGIDSQEKEKKNKREVRMEAGELGDRIEGETIKKTEERERGFAEQSTDAGEINRKMPHYMGPRENSAQMSTKS